jgi:hypothetical protein
MDKAGSTWRIRREIEFSHFVLAYHRILYIPTTSTFFRRRVFDEGNWIDLNYQYAMDYEFFLRLAHAGYCFQHVPQLLADFRWHSASKSGSEAAKQLEEHDRIARMYSPLLRQLPQGLPLTVVWIGVRLLAAGLRYSEKLVRGYYFEQFRTSSHQHNWC